MNNREQLAAESKSLGIHAATLTPEQERRIRTAHADGISINDLARYFGVRRERIREVIRGGPA